MTILYHPARRVNRPRPFGLGIARPARERRVGYTAADARWWAENSPANRDGHEVAFPSDAELERMAEESAELDRLCRGIVFI